MYKEVGKYGKAVEIKNPTSPKASLTISSDALNKTIHVILEAKDNGEPPLKGWRRAIINVKAN